MDRRIRLNDVELEQLLSLDGATRSTWRAGQVVIRADADERHVVAVLDGTLQVLQVIDGAGSVPIGSCEVGDVIGEISALTGAPRTADVVAVTDARCVLVPPAAWAEFLAAHPALLAEAIRTVHARLGLHRLRRTLAEILGPSVSQVSSIEPEIRLERVAAGDEVSLDRSAAVVVAGVVDGTGANRDMPGFAGMVVGTAALCGGSDDTTLRARTDVVVGFVDADAFSRLRVVDPDAACALLEGLVRRESHPPQRPTAPQSITVIDLVGGHIGSALIDAFRRRGDRRVVDAATVLDALSLRSLDPGTSDGPDAEREGGDLADRGTGAHDLDLLRMTAWFDDRRLAGEATVIVASGAERTWAGHAARSADRTVVLVRPGPVPSWLGRLLAPLGGRVHVVLAHPKGARPTGSSIVRASLPLASVVHLADGDTSHIERIVRIVAGGAVALVMSGGGASGFAHLAVAGALFDLGVPFDVTAGTSMGAVIAALLAQGNDPATCHQIMRDEFRSPFDWTFPAVALMTGDRIWRMLQRHLDGDVADLWLPFLCVSTDLTASARWLHVDGCLATAVRASVSIPGVLPPVPLDGHLLVDGGLVDNLPVIAVRERHADAIIIASDVATGTVARPVVGQTPVQSGWRELVARRRRMSAPRPISLGETMVRSMMVASIGQRYRIRDEGLADFYLPLDLQLAGRLDFDALDRVVDTARHTCSTPIASWVRDHEHLWRATPAPGDRDLIGPSGQPRLHDEA